MNNKKLFDYIDKYGGDSNNFIKIDNLDSMMDFESSDVLDNTEDYTSSLLSKILSNGSTNDNEDNNQLSDISGGWLPLALKITSTFGPGVKKFAKKAVSNASQSVIQSSDHSVDTKKIGKKDISRASKKNKSNKNGDTKVKGIGSKIRSNIISQFNKRREEKARKAQEKAEAQKAQALKKAEAQEKAKAQAQAQEAPEAQEAKARKAKADKLNFDELLGQLEALKTTISNNVNNNELNNVNNNELNNVNNNELNLKGMLSNLKKMKKTIIS